MIQGKKELSNIDAGGGLNTVKNYFALGPNQTPDCMDVKFPFGGFVQKRAGSTTTNSVALTDSAASGFLVDASGTLAQSIVSSWNMDEGSGTRVDTFGNNNLSDANTVTSTAGKLATAAFFNSAQSEYLYAAGPNTIATGNFNFTWAGWARLDSKGANKRIISKWDTDHSAQTFQLYFSDGDDRFVWYLEGTGGNNFVNEGSLGSPTTGAFYFIEVWYSMTSPHIGIRVNNGAATTAAFTHGVRAGTGTFYVGANRDNSGHWDGAIDNHNYWTKLLTTQERTDMYNAGSGNTYNGAVSSAGFGMFDFGAGKSNGQDLRWNVIAAGTGIYASSNRGVTYVVIATDRGADFQYFARIKNLLLATSETGNRVLYWSGSGGTSMVGLPVGSAPAAKFALEFEGFALLMNDPSNQRQITYEDNDLVLTGPWNRSFEIPGSQGNEITGGAILNGKAYVFTKTSVHRLSAVGGNPDIAESTIKTTFGAIPRTIKKVSYKDFGEVLMFLSYDRKLRIFDGTDEQVISSIIEEDNGLSEFYMNNLNERQLNRAHAELIEDEQVYRLWCVLAPSSEITHAINVNLRTGAMYPYRQDGLRSAVIAESGNTRILLGVKRDGFVHHLDTGNTDAGIPINEHYTSPFLFDKSPKTATKSQQLDFYFAATSSGRLYLEDQTAFSDAFSGLRGTIDLVAGGGSVQVLKTIDLPITSNVYRYKLSSSASTADPWQLNRQDWTFNSLGMGRSNG